MINTAWPSFRARRFAAALAALVLLAAAPVPAQEQEQEQTLEALEERQASRAAEYERVAGRIELSKKRLTALTDEVAAVRQDRAALTTALIQAAKTERKLSEDIAAIADRLDELRDRQGTIRDSLAARRGVLAEVLGALQRMGLNPPPAILVRPEDALASVRSAILLGAVVPELRTETDKLAADLKELSRVAASIEAERNRLRETVTEQIAEKRRLELLLDKKKQLQAETEAEIADERETVDALAERAGDLRELIAALEDKSASLRKAREEAEAEEKRRREAERAAVEEDRSLRASRPFSERRGNVAPPVPGQFDLRFGEDDGAGGTVMGDILKTQSGAIVTAPADGTVLYAGPFRSYGQLLILNAGDGYHIVLAGMDRISVSLGQSVLVGEPVGAMGEARLASIASLSDGNSAPELYVEFRRDGQPVDPAPWWSDRLSGRTGNDT